MCVCIFVNTWILQNISGNTHKKPVTVVATSEGNKAAGSISGILFYLSNSSPTHVFTIQKLILTCKKKSSQWSNTFEILKRNYFQSHFF